MLQTGTVLAGKYRVERVLGEGGMGVVVQAHHLQLDQPVAVKVLRAEMAADSNVVQRFLREAQAAVRLRSAHVARVSDVGSLETGEPYMVLEYLDGVDLKEYAKGQLDVGTIVDLMLQACEALCEAHSAGIVHRDIKPANMFIAQHPDGSAIMKLLDFGISKSLSPYEAHLTATQSVMGTPTYMSPEQMKATRDVDHRTDIWSLGVCLYELFQGGPPFSADTFTSLAIKVATEPLPPFSVRLPDGLAEVVYRCLHKDPGARFQTVALLARALAPYARTPTQAAITVERTSRISSPAIAETIVSATPVAIAPAMPTSSSRRRWPLVAAAATVVVALIAVILVMGRDESRPAPPPAEEPAAAIPMKTTVPPPPPVEPAPAPIEPPPPPVVEPAGSAEPAPITNKRKPARPKPKPTSGGDILDTRN